MSLSFTSSPILIGLLVLIVFILIQTARAAYYKGQCENVTLLADLAKERQDAFIDSLSDEINYQRKRADGLESTLAKSLQLTLADTLAHSANDTLAEPPLASTPLRTFAGETDFLPDDTPTPEQAAAAIPSGVSFLDKLTKA